MTLAAVAQVAIAFTGLTAVFLTQTPRWARWACWFGLAGEPAWFYSSFSAHQWGIFALAFFYTFAWGKGVWTYWLAPYMLRRSRMEKLLDHRCSHGPKYTLGCITCGSAAMKVEVSDK